MEYSIPESRAVQKAKKSAEAPNMKRTALFLREDQIAKLEALSTKTMAPVAAHVRAAIDEYLSKKK